MKRLFHVLALTLLMGIPICSRATGVVTITVTNVAANITPDRDCYSIVVRENAATPTAVFDITLAGDATAHHYAAGTQYILRAQAGVGGKASPFKAGVAVGTIVATTAGPFTFTADEFYSEPSIAAKNASGAGGGNTTAKYMLGAADVTLTNAKAIPGVYNGPQVVPTSPTVYDCEFTTDACSFTTWVAQGSSATTFANDRMIFNNDGTTGGSSSFVGEATPSPTYQFDSSFCLAAKPNSSYLTGLALEETATGKIEWSGLYIGNGLVVGHGTTAGINSVDIADTFLTPPCWYVRVKVDSTNIVWSASFDGIIWRQFLSHAKTANFTTAPDRVGWVMANYGQNAVSIDFIRRTL